MNNQPVNIEYTLEELQEAHENALAALATNATWVFKVKRAQDRVVKAQEELANAESDLRHLVMETSPPRVGMAIIHKL